MYRSDYVLVRAGEEGAAALEAGANFAIAQSMLHCVQVGSHCRSKCSMIVTGRGGCSHTGFVEDHIGSYAGSYTAHSTTSDVSGFFEYVLHIFYVPEAWLEKLLRPPDLSREFPGAKLYASFRLSKHKFRPFCKVGVKATF